MKKKFIYFCLTLFLIMIVSGCAPKTVEPASKEEKSNRPVADNGVAYATKELEFYLPSDFEKSPTNGMLGVYEFYTGTLKDAGPTGIDVMILLDPIDEEFVLEDYVQNQVSNLQEGITLKKETINDAEWYVGKTDKTKYYYATFRDNKYEVKITIHDDSTKLYEDTIKMFEKTMYLEELDEK